MKPNLILFIPQLLPVIIKVSGSSYLSKSMPQRTQNTLVYNIRVSQGSVVTRLRCGWIFNDSFITQLSRRVHATTFIHRVSKNCASVIF